MKNKYFYNLISAILICCFVFTPFFSVWKTKKAEAQSVSGYVGGLLPIIVKLPQCSAVISNKMKGLFNSIGGLFSGSDKGSTRETGPNGELPEDLEVDYDPELGFYDEETDTFGLPDANLDGINDPSKSGNLENIAEEYAGIIDSVKVNISGTSEGRAILETNERTKSIQKSAQSIDENSKCHQSIGRLIIKMLLQKVTVSTVNWINSGFDGKPAFIQNTGKFFGDIAKNEILQFGLEISNPELFPFGKEWIRNTATSFNNKFIDNAQYSLDTLIKNTNPEYSAITFQQDFSMGGWGAWTAMTQSQANNPIGFKILADNEIQKRLAGTEQSVAQSVRDALQAADGFLGDERCADPKGLTRQEDYEAKVRGVVDADGFIEGACKEWQYVTPGRLVSEAAQNAFNYQNNAYLDVEDLNDAIAAVIDALLQQFSSQIMEKGFAEFGDIGSDGRLIYDNSYTGGPYRSRTEQDFAPVHLSNSWLSANPDFNIRTDLSQSLIDEQRTYSDKLALQNKELLSTTDGQPYKIDPATGVSNAYGLLPTIYQLDYCIPGPHPGFEDDSRINLAETLNLITPETKESLKAREMKDIVKAVGQVTQGIRRVLAPINPINIFFKLIGLKDDDDLKVRGYYSKQFADITGYLPDYDNKNDDRVGNILNKHGMTNITNLVLERYIDIMDKIYFSDPDILPTVANEAASAFDQSRGYAQMIRKNEEKIASLKTTVGILGEIKESVDALNLEFPEKGAIYEEALSAEINAFGRVSSSMVNGNDIAKADNILKQIIDKKDYIYKNLLKGPYGCEADLMKPAKNFPSPAGTVLEMSLDWKNFNVNSVKRMTYTLQILYDYNVFGKNMTLPNPAENLNIQLSEKEKAEFLEIRMPSENQYDIYGPGFLSFVVFSTEESSSKLERGPERLKMHDLVPQDRNEGSRYRALGDRTPIQMPTGSTGTGVFEYTIGIY